jgi:phosphoribosylformylglycinamidine cyclo-ligase
VSGDGAASYAAAGVDIEAGDLAVELMRSAVARTARPEVIGGIGGFAGLFDASKLAGYRRPVLATATDGVGTKVTIAQRLGRYGTVGQDLVAMVADDLVVCGAEPLFLTDYVVCGRVWPERVAEIVAGVAEGCVRAGCALLGGETAEHPGHLGPDDFDLAGAATGVVEADRLLGPDRVRPGDVLIAMASSGLHSNGFSLVRRVIDEPGRELPLDRDPGGLGRPLGDELLEPTRIYALDCLALAAEAQAHAFAHITGGGLAGNLSRVLPDGLVATVDRATWAPHAVFDLIARVGRVGRAELEVTFNLGVGMIAVVPADRVDDALALARTRSLPAWVLGRVENGFSPGSGRVVLAGSYAGPAASWT